MVTEYTLYYISCLESEETYEDSLYLRHYEIQEYIATMPRHILYYIIFADIHINITCFFGLFTFT